MTLPLRNHLGRKLDFTLGREVYGVVCCYGVVGALPYAINAGPRLDYTLGREVIGTACCLPAGVLVGTNLPAVRLDYTLGREVYGVAEPCCPGDGGSSGSDSGSSGSGVPPTCPLICSGGVSTVLTAAAGSADTTLTVASSAGFPATPFYAVIDDGTAGYEILTVTNISGLTWTVTRGCDQFGSCTGGGNVYAGTETIYWEFDPPDTLLATATVYCDPDTDEVPFTLTRYGSECGAVVDDADQTITPALCGWGGTFSDANGNSWTMCLFTYREGPGGGGLSWEVALHCNGTIHPDTVYGLVKNTGSGLVVITENDCDPFDLDISYSQPPDSPCSCSIFSITVVE